MTLLISADIGNVTTKYRAQGDAWTIAPALVRLAPSDQPYALLDDAPPARPLVYLSGPAQLAPLPYLVGRDAERGGADQVPIIGSAEVRVQSSAYLLLHLHALLASLPADVREAEVAFAGGVPMLDYGTPAVPALRERLRGTHHLRWGDLSYRLTISKLLIVPQPIGGIASLIFTPEGRIQANGALARQRFGLDVGGGTADFTGRVGLQAIEGSEGGVAIGVQTAAEYAATQIRRRYPQLRQLDAARVLGLLRRGETHLYVGGALTDVGAELAAGLEQAAEQILAHVLPRWQRRLAEGEVLLYGGGSVALAQPLRARLDPLTTVLPLPDPLLRVVMGIERLAKYQLGAQGE